MLLTREGEGSQGKAHGGGPGDRLSDRLLTAQVARDGTIGFRQPNQ